MKILPAIVFVFMLLLVVVSNGVIAQTPTPEPTVLGPGDIVIVGYNTVSDINGNQDFAILFLTNVNQGTRINFTDYGWDGNAFVTKINYNTVSDDDDFDWEADTNYLPGTVKVITHDPDETSSNFNIKGGGDQIFIFQGNYLTNPNLIFGVNINYASWQNAVSSSSQSKLPEVLQFANTTNILGNAKYDILNGTTFTSADNAMMEIANSENWIGHETSRQNFDSLDGFDIAPTNIDIEYFRVSNKRFLTQFMILFLLLIMVIILIKNLAKVLSFK